MTRLGFLAYSLEALADDVACVERIVRLGFVPAPPSNDGARVVRPKRLPLRGGLNPALKPFASALADVILADLTRDPPARR